MKVCYVAGPYRAETIGGVLHNINRAGDIALALWKMGYAAICPHKNTALFDGALPDSVWLDGDIEILKRCDFVVMVPGWEQSSGSIKERKTAASLSIPVYEWDEISNGLLIG